MKRLHYFFVIWLPEHTLCAWFGHKWVGNPGDESCGRCGVTLKEGLK